MGILRGRERAISPFPFPYIKTDDEDILNKRFSYRRTFLIDKSLIKLYYIL
jgi:hypothetical protein